ncbi:MAG: radical SAM protein [Thermosphaera sp.]
MKNLLVVDALARAKGERYSTFDVVGAGPRIVAGILEEENNVSLKPFEEVFNKTREYLHFDYVFISGMTSDKHAIQKLVSKMRRKGFKGEIIIGGPISVEGHQLLKEIPGADYIIVGEGEVPLQKFLDCVIKEKCDESRVPSLIYRNGSKIVETTGPVPAPLELINGIKPWTKLHLSYNPPSIYRIYVEAVRGCSNFYRPLLQTLGCLKCMGCRKGTYALRLECPANIPPGCGFCNVPSLFGPPRSRSPNAIRHEVEELIGNGARRIVLSAPDFLDYKRGEIAHILPMTDPCSPPANIEAIEALLNELFSIKEVESGKVVISVENIKACLVNEEVASTLGKYLKGTTIHIGCETGDAEYNQRVLGKPIDPRDVIKASKLLHEHGLRPYVYLMYGLPLMNSRVYRKTLSIINDLAGAGVEKITLYKYVQLPKTSFAVKNLRPSFNKEITLAMKKAIERYNLISKQRLLGEVLEAYMLEKDGKIYGYPVRHGPVIFVEKALSSIEAINGCKARVLITDVAPRFVKGVILEVLECP